MEINFKVKEVVLQFMGKSWEKKKIDNEKILIKPKYMVKNVDWFDMTNILESKIPFILLYEKDNKTVSVRSYSGTVREVPIFYSLQGDKLILTDSPKSLFLKNDDLSSIAIKEFLTFGYVTSNGTLFKNVHQLEAGQELIYEEGTVEIKNVFLYKSNKEQHQTDENIKSELVKIAKSIFNELKDPLKNKTILVPLSSGYDSRFIVSMLKLCGYKDVICFTWGYPDDKHVRVSSKIAEVLGYEWVNIHNDMETWDQIVHSEWIEKLLIESSDWTSISGIASLPLQNYLRKENIDVEECIIMPGHTAAFQASGDFNRFNDEKLSPKELARQIIKYESLRVNYDRDIIAKLEEQFDVYASESTSLDAIRTWIWRERQAKFIVNTNRYYEALNIKWTLPLWDYRLVEFWQQFSIDEINNKTAYKNILKNEIFNLVGVGFELEAENNSIFLTFKMMLFKKVPFLLNLARFAKKVRRKKHEHGFHIVFPLLEKRMEDNYYDISDKIKNIPKKLFDNSLNGYSTLASYVLSLLINELNEP